MGWTSSDRAWRKWGKIDPYFAVLTKPEYRAQEIDRHRQAFFEEGEDYIEALLTRIGHICPQMQRGRALDFGCGVGRLTLPLARRFDEAVGVDISPAMLEEAEANARAAGLANARFALSDDSLSRAEGLFDLVQTYIVLQHIPVARGLAYIERLLDLVRPGGVAALHFTIDRGTGALRDSLNWAQRNLPLVNNLANLARGRRFAEPLMQMNEYPLASVLALFERHGIPDALVSLDRQQGILAAVVIGRKP